MIAGFQYLETEVFELEQVLSVFVCSRMLRATEVVPPMSIRSTSTMQLEPHELALYTEAYKQRAPDAEVFRGSLQAW